MNADIAEAKWKQLKGNLKQQWGKLTDDDLDRINGKREEWAGIMQEKYGMGRDEAQREFEKFNH